MADSKPKPMSTKQLKKHYATIFSPPAGTETATDGPAYYPVDVFAKWNMKRHQCPGCGCNYWASHPNPTNCGDSTCTMKYGFINNAPFASDVRPAKVGDAYTMTDVWNNFQAKMESLKTTVTNPSKNNEVIETIGHTAIPRYPVVARWRKDVDFVIAGIFCFQPHCVSGELEPPANPLVCPQFCLRFGDLDNIGFTGRHYSGFHMLGEQVFNGPEKDVYFKDGTIDNNLHWLTDNDGLALDIDRLRLKEDVWSGGGNLGPCVEVFIDGLEVGNMVFMQYRVDDNNELVPLERQTVDVGIGLERLPWLLNGSETSYGHAFPVARGALAEIAGIQEESDDYKTSVAMWNAFAPYSCHLDMDEATPEKAWQTVLTEMAKDGVAVPEVPEDGNFARAIIDAIGPVKDMYIVLDHTRTLLFALFDGCIPSNQGGGSNLRRVIRRTFRIMQDRGWNMDGAKDAMVDRLWAVMVAHTTDLRTMHGEADLHIDERSFKGIIDSEYTKMMATDAKAVAEDTKAVKEQLDKLAKVLKGLPADESAHDAKAAAILDFWAELFVDKAVALDSVKLVLETMAKDKKAAKYAEILKTVGTEPPSNVSSEINDRQEARRATQNQTEKKKAAVYHLDAATARQTEYMLERDDADEQHHDLVREFDSKVVAVIENVITEHDTAEHKYKGHRNVVVIAQTYCYPVSGGQDCDQGTVTVDGTRYRLYAVTKDGPVVIHYLCAMDGAPVDLDVAPGTPIHVEIDFTRRTQLRVHHTAAHLIHAAAHKVLGAHVWQQGAHKRVDLARLDISHYAPVSFEQRMEIQAAANELIKGGHAIHKYTLAKESAEKQYGYTLYQGGIVPGNTVRTVRIGEDDAIVDVEACCGTHCDNTDELGQIVVIRTNSVRDGVQRLEFVAGDAAARFLQSVEEREQALCTCHGLDTPEDLVDAARATFKDRAKCEKALIGLKDNVLALAATALDRRTVIHTDAYMMNKANKLMATVAQTAAANGWADWALLFAFEQDGNTTLQGFACESVADKAKQLFEENKADRKVTLREQVKTDKKAGKVSNLTVSLPPAAAAAVIADFERVVEPRHKTAPSSRAVAAEGSFKPDTENVRMQAREQAMMELYQSQDADTLVTIATRITQEADLFHAQCVGLIETIYGLLGATYGPLVDADAANGRSVLYTHEMVSGTWSEPALLAEALRGPGKHAALISGPRTNTAQAGVTGYIMGWANAEAAEELKTVFGGDAKVWEDQEAGCPMYEEVDGLVKVTATTDLNWMKQCLKAAGYADDKWNESKGKKGKK
ncbi:Alanine-tRNA ligase class IIc [Carpediemonas membranifera]|uniref:Alanine--tRNA ligase n=1 Tax=Carpediemonas membranifera TaxID=201153 RepID=A0A8J6AUY4_9EUKA|nr:Alanine-tRNA ligase class IIc [Carpediemonas membranifera]|eukprot:KAG9393140.1 Alanine-tRNA ligase class IIc [Carpediemonas membranifera]